MTNMTNLETEWKQQGIRTLIYNTFCSNFYFDFFIDIIKKNNIFQVKIPCFETKNKTKRGQNKQKQNLVNKNNMDI